MLTIGQSTAVTDNNWLPELIVSALTNINQLFSLNGRASLEPDAYYHKNWFVIFANTLLH